MQEVVNLQSPFAPLDPEYWDSTLKVAFRYPKIPQIPKLDGVGPVDNRPYRPTDPTGMGDMLRDYFVTVS